MILLPLLLFFPVLNSVKSAELTLSVQGKTDYGIVVTDKTSECMLFAAAELQKYLMAMSKANFKITPKIQKKSIILKINNQLSKQNPFCQNKYPNDSYAIQTEGKHIFISGSNPRSVLYGVYDFLKQIGCEWVSPDYHFMHGSGTKIPGKTVLNYTQKVMKTEEPAFYYRKYYVEEGRSHNLEYLKNLIDWMPKSRMNILVFPTDYEGRSEIKWDNWRKELIPELQKRNIIIEVGGHGYQNFLSPAMENGSLFENHPEWFGVDLTGQRSAKPNMVFCTSNDNAINYLYRNVVAYLRERPEISIFDFWPPDMEKWCNCKECMQKGTESERHVILVNKVAEKLKIDLPSVKLECLSYNKHTKPSDKVRLNDDVLLDFCPIAQNYEYQIYESYNEKNVAYLNDLLKWKTVFDGDISIYSYYRKYSWRSLPNIIPNYMQKDIQYYRNAGIKGISIYSEPGDWFTYGVNHFVFTQLLWNPDVSADSLKKVYASLVFRDYEQLATEIFTELEQTVRFACNIAQSTLKSAEVYDKYLSRVTEYREKLAKAINHVQDTVLHENLTRLDLMLNYTAQSILYMRSRTMDNEEYTKKLDMEIKLFLRKHANKGIFIPHRYI